MPQGLRFSASFFLLFLLSLLFFAAGIASARTAQDAAYDERGQFVLDRYGKCVRTKWDGDTDPCAPPPPPPPVKKAAPPPPPPKVGHEQRTILFDFDSAELDNEARAKLDHLARIINGSRAIKDVHIIGFADQIGSDSYNVKLSQRRASAVEQYLDRRTRLDTRVADIRGLGEAPDTGKCDNLPRQRRIACLRPQRRVEVEFKYLER